MKFRALITGIMLTGTLTASGLAAAATCTNNIGTIGTTLFSCDVAVNPGLFLGTINFNVAQPNVLMTITSQVNNITFFSIPIFENDTDSEFVGDADGQHASVDLSAFAAPGPGYHIHPQGLVGAGGGTYTVNFQASPVPVPAAVWLLGSGLVGLAGWGTRRRSS